MKTVTALIEFQLLHFQFQNLKLLQDSFMQFNGQILNCFIIFFKFTKGISNSSGLIAKPYLNKIDPIDDDD